MGRRLPDPIQREPDETDEDFLAREASSKRRLQIMKRVYRQYYYWQSLRVAGEVDDIITVEGVDIYIGDLMVGFDTLPDQQRKAFHLICLEGYTENAATEVILPNSKWSTPVQQYADDGLKKMVAAYDAKQAGTWDPSLVHRRKPTRRTVTVTTRKKTKKREWNFNDTNEDQQAFADYIQIKTGLEITAPMIKAVSYLKNEWYNSPEAIAARQRRKDEREALKAKYAYETPAQHDARLAAARTLAKHARALGKAQQLMEEMKKLRVEAGLDPETGEPLTG